MSQPKFSLPEVKSQYLDVETPILEYWKKNKIFEKSVDSRPDSDHFVFYDGPPFVTGTPHYGHLLSSILKDVVPRYQTMLGKRVERVWGWDCHGLPVEEKVERTLGSKNRRDIENEIGIQKFIDACFNYVQNTSAEWPWYVDRIARWVNMDTPYRTMDKNYMETVIWVFKQLYEKELIYKGKRVSLYCTRCGTPISNFEVAMDNSYKDLQDPSLFVKFKAKDFEKSDVLAKFAGKNVYFVAWTTTPWTLPENAAIAVSKDETYVATTKEDGDILIFAKSRLEAVLEKAEYDVVAEFTGEKLVGTKYEPLFSYFKPNENDHQVLAADFVSMDDGSGIVHIAPGYGEDDTELGKANKLSVFDGIDDEGKMVPEVTEFAGMYLKKADEPIIKNLEARGLVLRAGQIMHSYPLCYRCQTPLIYKSQDSWYVDVTNLKPQLEEHNESINWVPEHIKHGRFLAGIKTAPDWGVSRTRYWATPMPIWECDSCDKREVLGSIAEIEAKSGKKVTDLHRPYIDEHTFACDCGGTMKRVEEVLDCWLESASMPFAQLHYPFENKEKFEKNFPGDYIVEYVPQTRAWFYVMHVVSTALFGRNAFKNVICHGTINGNDGRKMSKSFGNYPDPKAVLEKFGGDALRMYLMNSVLPYGEDIDVSEEKIGGQNRDVIMPLLNVYKYFALYANQHNFTPDFSKDSEQMLDKWILARVKHATVAVKENMDKYYIQQATAQLKPLIDDISTWYIRRSRDRFVAGDADALNTLFKAIYYTVRLSAPFMPFTAEHVYQQIKTGLPKDMQLESIHLDYLNSFDTVTVQEAELLDRMKLVRDLTSASLSIRDEKALPLKQPLGALEVVTAEKLSPEFLELIQNEVNVLGVEQVDLVESFTSGYELKTLENGSVALNIELTPDLIAKGTARELMRAIQVARKSTGFEMGEKASATIYAAQEELIAMLKPEANSIKEQTSLSDIKFEFAADLAGIADEPVKLKQGTYSVVVELKKVA